MKDKEAVFYNVDKSEIIYRMNNNAERDLEGMLESLRARTIPNYYQTTVHFYEVDNREENEKSWDASMVLLSNPKSLGSAGLPGYGEIKVKGMKLSLESVGRQEADAIHNKMTLTFDYKGEKISEDFPIKTSLGLTNVIELKRGAKRSLVAMVVVEEIR